MLQARNYEFPGKCGSLQEKPKAGDPVLGMQRRLLSKRNLQTQLNFTEKRQKVRNAAPSSDVINLHFLYGNCTQQYNAHSALPKGLGGGEAFSTGREKSLPASPAADYATPGDSQNMVGECVVRAAKERRNCVQPSRNVMLRCENLGKTRTQ